MNCEKAPSEQEYDVAFTNRNGAAVHQTMKDMTIGIAGLGGLGSNVALMLVRAGVKKLVIADNDIVGLPHLNRQNYMFKHIGCKKTDATEDVLLSVNPYLEIEKHAVKIDTTNAKTIFGECDAICEAMDKSDEKADFANTILRECPDIFIVSGSGMAGYGRSNAITTKKSLKELYICGDMGDLEDRAEFVLSPRSQICAGHIANTMVALLMGGKF